MIFFGDRFLQSNRFYSPDGGYENIDYTKYSISNWSKKYTDDANESRVNSAYEGGISNKLKIKLNVRITELKIKAPLHFWGKFLCLLLFIPSVALSGLEHREYVEKYAQEVGNMLHNELVAQGVCVNKCNNAAFGYWTMESRKNEFETSLFIPKGKSLNRAKIINIFSDIHSRDDINITLSFYDGSHHDYENRKAKKVAMVKFKSYR